MDVILASSRGKGILPILRDLHPSPHHLMLNPTSGATIAELTDQAITIIRKAKNPRDYHFYFIGGYCDITHRMQRTMNLSGRAVFNEEITFQEDPDVTVARLSQIIATSSDRIKSYGAIPIFCTIAPSSLHTWNHTRLSQKKTSHLEHFNNYPHMQENLIQAIIRTNQVINEMNETNQVATP